MLKTCLDFFDVICFFVLFLVMYVICLYIASTWGDR